jgi:ankyrin repeat protein
LHLAAGEGHARVVEVLLQNGANVNAEDRWGGRPLDDAERNNHKDAMRVLKRFGAVSSSSSHHISHSSGADDLDYEDSNLHIDYSSLQIIERIGVGAFGEIYKCRWYERVQICGNVVFLH